jgi:hypothetical protein
VAGLTLAAYLMPAGIGDASLDVILEDWRSRGART